MRYTFEMLREDIHQLSVVTSGLREYTPEAAWPRVQLEDTGDELALNPNTPEAAACDYFLQRYGDDGVDFYARFIAVHDFVVRHGEKLARRGFLHPNPEGPSMANDLLYFLLTCFEDPVPPARMPRSIYDQRGGVRLPYQDVLADFHRLRALRERLHRD